MSTANTATIRPFHLAFPVLDLETTKNFYRDVLGCNIGRQAERWVDFDLFGHQLSAHLIDEAEAAPATSKVDGKNVPVRHFGVVLGWGEWHQFAERLRAQKTQFVIEPYIRFKEARGEQATMFFLDPSGNALEFKAFKDSSQLFAA